MSFLDSMAEKWSGFSAKAKPAAKKIGTFFENVGRKLRVVWRYMVRLKKVILAIPVVFGSVYLAVRNMRELPAVVGLNLQADGTFAIQIAREVAVLGPIAITALCLLLMFCSNRTLTPWLVSLFSLAVPLLILVTNIFPA